MRRELDINMPGNEGSKKDGNFTKKEKWMVGVYIVTAITSTVLFVMTLVVISQLKGPVDDTKANTSEHESAASSASGKWEEKYRELLNRMDIKDAEIRKLAENLTRITNKMETTTNKSKKLIELAFKGWYQATNKLLYKRSRIEKTFSDAWEDCKKQGARLAATGMRLSDVRSEIWSNLIPKNEYVWIGLNKSDENHNWTWSDGKAYDGSSFKLTLSDYYYVSYAVLWRESSGITLAQSYSTTATYTFVCEYNATHLTVY